MARKPTVFPLEKVDKAINKLESFAAHPKGLSYGELISKAYPQIKAALESGYSFEEIAQVFGEEEITIPASRIKSEFLLFEKDKETKAIGKSKSKGKVISDTNLASQSEDQKYNISEEKKLDSQTIFNRESPEQNDVISQFNIN